MPGVKDVYTKEIVGYAIDKRMNADLVCKALNMSIKINIRITTLSFILTEAVNIAVNNGSMSRKSNCYDNAPIERFWGKLKNELVYHHNYQTRQEAIAMSCNILSLNIIKENSKGVALNRTDRFMMNFTAMPLNQNLSSRVLRI